MKSSQVVRAGITTLSVAAVLAGCGGSSPTPSQTVRSRPRTTSARTSTPPTTATQSVASGPSLGAPVNRETYALAGTGGYTGKMVVSIYHAAKVSALPPLPYSGRNALSSCSPDAASAAAVPISISVTNTTKGFAEPLHVSPLVGPGSYSPTTTFEIDATDQCGLPGGDFEWNWDAAAPNSPVDVDFYLIVPNYFSPAHPGGDAQILDHSCFISTAYFGTSGSEISLGTKPTGAMVMGRKGVRYCP